MWRWLKRGSLVVGLGVTLSIVVALVAGWSAFGATATGARKARVEKSPQWRDGHFVNAEPLANDWVGSLTGALHMSPHTTPAGTVETLTPTFAGPVADGLRVTWLGHSSMVIEIDGVRLLTDPAFSRRASPYTSVGPSRFFPPLTALPVFDAVIISHDHYDHLDQQTIIALAPSVPRFFVPLGVGAHLESWGVPATKIVELDWWEKSTVGRVDIVCTPARHASGRWPPVDQDATLWASWSIIGPQHRAYFSGDTGLFNALHTIAEKFGPFDVTLIEVGQYHRAWPDWHMGPEQALKAHQWLGGKHFIPIHWGLFALAYHGWTEPPERAWAAAQLAGVSLSIPKPGQTIELAAPLPVERWWPELPYDDAVAHPVLSSQIK
jgi:L-ascorbate metabolism protein UlaG (beta-lactamase superfamily)